jgi:hypothetical protein
MNMKKLMFGIVLATVLVIAVFPNCAFAALKNVAVVEMDIDPQSGVAAEMTPAEVRLITAELRREAVKNLPRGAYNVMTSETVMAQGSATLVDCSEENCVIALGSRIGADYIVRGTISKFQTLFALTVDVYETENGNLVASSDPVRSENARGLLEKAAEVCAKMYRDFADAQPVVSAPVPAAPPLLRDNTPVTAPVPAPVAKNPEIAESVPQAEGPGPVAKITPKPAPPPASPVPPFPPSAGTANTAENAEQVPETIFMTRRSYNALYSGMSNPALVNEERRKSLRFLFEGTMELFKTLEIGFNMPLGRNDAAGISWMANISPVYDATDESGMATGAKIADQRHFFALTYARNAWKDLTLGGNLNIIARNAAEFNEANVVGDAMRLGFGLDIGLTCKVMRHPLFGNHVLGVSANDIFNMISETDGKEPAALRFSLLSDFWEGRVCYGADFDLKDIFAGPEDFLTDVEPVTRWEFNHELGIGILRVFKLYMLVGFGNEGVGRYGFAFGASAGRFLKPGFFRDAEVMMQYVSITNNGSVSEAGVSRMTFFARTEFGENRNR